MAIYVRQLQVDVCPRCQRLHVFSVDVITADDIARPAALFGGPTDQGRGDEKWQVFLTCPDGAGTFNWPFDPLLPSNVVVSAVTEHDASRPAVETLSPDWRPAEMQEWLRTSASTARDFAKTMITVSTAAVPVYFATTKFLGLEHVRSGWWALAALPPVLLLVAALGFSVAMRPVLTTPDSLEDFASWRELRLRKMDGRIRWAMGCFLAAIAAAAVVWAVLLFR